MSVRFATIDDLTFVKSLEKINYGFDAWDYSLEEWTKQISNRDPAIWIKEGSSFKFNKYGGNVILICGSSYLQYSLQPARSDTVGGGYYLTSIAGLGNDLENLIKYFFSFQTTGRFYTHAKPEWAQGKMFSLLESFGFKNVGRGDNLREVGKWKMDLSELNEFEFIKR